MTYIHLRTWSFSLQRSNAYCQLLVNGSFFQKKKKLVPHGKKTRTFFGLYTKTHFWACIRLEKMGGLTSTRNGLKARFQCKSMDP